MTFLHITEYVTSEQQEPAIAEQVISLGQEPALSKPFDRRTRSVRLMADVDCALSFGLDPVATRNSGMVAARQEQIRQIAGEGFKVSAVLLANDAALSTSSVEGLIALITNHEAASRRLKDLKALHESSLLASQQAIKDQDGLDQRKAEMEAAEADLRRRMADWHAFYEPANAALRSLEATLKEQTNALAQESAAYAQDHAVRETALAAREERVSQREREVQAREKIMTDLKLNLQRAAAVA